MDLSNETWSALQALAEKTGFPAGRVTNLRRLMTEDAISRPGAPYTAVAGIGDTEHGGPLEWLVPHWLSPQADDALRASGGKPLIVGAAPETVKLPLHAWPTFSWPDWRHGHFLLMRVKNKVPADILSQFHSLGYIDQLLLVTRLGQPLDEQEREIARTFASFTATVRVLMVGLPGEAPDAQLDNPTTVMTQLANYARAQLHNAGFGGERYLGSAVWYTDSEIRYGSIDAVTPWLVPNDIRVNSGKEGMQRLAVRGFFTDLRQNVDAAGQKVTSPLPMTDTARQDLATQFARYLADIGLELEREAAQRPNITAQALREYVVDSIRGWQAYGSAGAPGTWLKRVEGLRPGLHAGLLKETERALSLLDFNPALRPTPAQAPAVRPRSAVLRSTSVAEPPSMIDQLVTEAKRAGVGLVIGIVLYILVTGVTASLTPTAPNTAGGLPPIVTTVLGIASLLIGALLGYAVARRFIRLPGEVTTSRTLARHTMQSEAVGSPSVERNLPGEKQTGILGWKQIERRLAAWFETFVDTQPVSLGDEVATLEQIFGVER